MRLVFVALVSFLTALLTVNSSIQNGILTNIAESYIYSPVTLYNCDYSGMWCSCYTNNRGGCSVGCSPNTYFVLYNQTSCPQVENFVLSGFTLS